MYPLDSWSTDIPAHGVQASLCSGVLGVQSSIHAAAVHDVIPLVRCQPMYHGSILAVCAHWLAVSVVLDV
jgi:hypothetical protein